MKFMHSLATASIFLSSAGVAQDNQPLPVTSLAGRSSPSTMVMPPNTAMILRLNQDLSSKTAREGTMFDLSVAEDVIFNGYVVIPRNSKAIGEVTWRTGKGAFGKSAKMNFEMRHVEVLGRRIPITGAYRQEGEGNTAATIGGVLAAGVFAGFITGKTALVPAGRELKAHTQEEVVLTLPAAQSVPGEGGLQVSPAAIPVAQYASPNRFVNRALEINVTR